MERLDMMMNEVENEMLHMDTERYCATLEHYETAMMELDKEIFVLKETNRALQDEVRIRRETFEEAMDQLEESKRQNLHLNVVNKRLMKLRDDMVGTVEHEREKNRNLEEQLKDEKKFANEVKFALEGFLFDQDIQEALKTDEEEREVTGWF